MHDKYSSYKLNQRMGEKIICKNSENYYLTKIINNNN